MNVPPHDPGFLKEVAHTLSKIVEPFMRPMVAKVASLIAIVIGGYQFAHGEPGGKKALAGVAAGTGIAVLAANVLTWLWGVYQQQV